MKRKGGLFHQVSDWDALLAATRRAARGKRHRPDVAGRWFGGEHRRQRQRLLIPPPQPLRHRRPADALGPRKLGPRRVHALGHHPCPAHPALTRNPFRLRWRLRLRRHAGSQACVRAG